MKKFLALFIFLITNVHSAEYIVTLKDPKDLKKLEVLAEKLEKLSPDKMQSLGRGVFVLKYTQDPGLKKLQESLGKEIAVQPNYEYKTLKTPQKMGTKAPKAPKKTD